MADRPPEEDLEPVHFSITCSIHTRVNGPVDPAHAGISTIFAFTIANESNGFLGQCECDSIKASSISCIAITR